MTHHHTSKEWTPHLHVCGNPNTCTAIIKITAFCYVMPHFAGTSCFHLHHNTKLQNMVDFTLNICSSLSVREVTYTNFLNECFVWLWFVQLYRFLCIYNGCSVENHTTDSKWKYTVLLKMKSCLTMTNCNQQNLKDSGNFSYLVWKRICGINGYCLLWSSGTLILFSIVLCRRHYRDAHYSSVV